MFDNVAFNVVIGLVLIYLLYSLLVTILSETISRWFYIRATLLRFSIQRMLNDGNPANAGTGTKDLTPEQQAAMLKISLAGRFFDYPSIKYLAKADSGQYKQKFPSYISAENFADALINILIDKGTGSSPMEQIAFCLQYNTLLIDDETLRQLRDMHASAPADQVAFRKNLMKWFSETQDRTTGWYKRIVRLISFWLGFIIAISFNVDSIRIARTLSNDKEARNQLVNMGVALAKDTAKYGTFIYGNGDSMHTKAILDTGYAHVTKDINAANLVLGLGWHFDTLKNDLTVVIPYDEKAFKKLKAPVDSLDTLRKRFDSLIISIREHIDTLKDLQRQWKRAAIDTLSILIQKNAAKGDTKRLKFLDSVYQNRIDSKTAIELQINEHKGEIAYDSVYLLFNYSLMEAQKDLIVFEGKTAHTIIDSAHVVRDTNETTQKDSVSKNSIIIYGREPYTFFEDAGYLIVKIFHAYRLPGFLLTALALSLGAPFWFDLLKKLVSLRSTGVKPEEKKTPPVIESPPDLSTLLSRNLPNSSQPKSTEDPSVTALRDLTQKIKNETGIISLALEYKPDTKKAFIKVMVQTAVIKDILEKRMGTTIKTDGGDIPVEYATGREISTHGGNVGAEICNEKRKDNKGTLGCIMTKKGSDSLYFISCWHVIKDNTNWDQKPINNNILSDSTPLGMIETGVLSHDADIGIDIGIAMYNNINDATSNTQLPIKGQHREVTSFDALISTDVLLFGSSSKSKKAKIFHDKTNALIKYPDGNFHLLNDVFSIVSVDANPVTKEGDSGAVITDTNGTPLGIVIGGNGQLSYAIKFSNIFSENKPYSEYSFKTNS